MLRDYEIKSILEAVIMRTWKWGDGLTVITTTSRAE